MTRQEAFTKAYLGLQAQGFVKSEEGICLYRGPNNTKCAYGHLIPDSLYTLTMEYSGTVPELHDHYPHLDLPLRDDPDFARELQRCHDISDGPKHMKTRLEEFAFTYDLKVPS